MRRRTPIRRHRSARMLGRRALAGPVALAALAAVAGLLATGCTARVAANAGSSAASSSASTSVAPPTTSPSPTESPSPTGPVTPSATGAPVHIKLFGGDGGTYGVAMPVIAYLSKKITDAKGFNMATTVTVNGQPAAGGWYFEDSALLSGYPIEAHYRPQAYWPAHAAIKVTMNTQGVSGGPGFVFDDSLTLAWSTGKADILAVDGNTHLMTVTTDGVPYGTFPVSLGAPKTPTLLGTKVIMEFDRNERMIGPGYNEIVPWSMRVTNSGEFLHAAAWNVANIGKRSTSNGCTNLLPADAQRLFGYLQIGDPVTYTNVAGGVQPVWDGYGDWNVPWASWLAGGVVPSSA
jgi:lipoprotein-anchoring transpeptidase ErfK/SrfK